MTSGPDKGLRWRSQLSGTLLRLDRKPHSKVSILHPVSWPFINSSTFTYNIPSMEETVSLWTLKCVILPEVKHNKCCRRYQPMNHGALLMEAKKSVAAWGLAWHTDLHSPIFGGNPTKTNAGQLSAEGRKAHCVYSELKPLMCLSLSLSCSWTLAFLWSSCISQRLFCLFSLQSFADFLSVGRETQILPSLSFKKSGSIL